MKNTEFNDLNEILSSERYLRHAQQLEQAPLEIRTLLEQERRDRLAAEAEAERRHNFEFALTTALAIVAILIAAASLAVSVIVAAR